MQRPISINNRTWVLVLSGAEVVQHRNKGFKAPFTVLAVEYVHNIEAK